MIGETVEIQFYASGLPQSQAGNYTWFHDDIVINENLQDNRTKLVIPNVNQTHTGEYRFRVLYRITSTITSTAIAVTRLHLEGEN